MFWSPEKKRISVMSTRWRSFLVVGKTASLAVWLASSLARMAAMPRKKGEERSVTEDPPASFRSPVGEASGAVGGGVMRARLAAGALGWLSIECVIVSLFGVTATRADEGIDVLRSTQHNDIAPATLKR